MTTTLGLKVGSGFAVYKGGPCTLGFRVYGPYIRYIEGRWRVQGGTTSHALYTKG